MHEQYKKYGLINISRLNSVGRLYDQILGSIIISDIYVHESYNSFNSNRYSYALNNPMKYTDPTGYIPCEFKLDAYFNWMTNRDINYAHDGVYYSESIEI